MHLFDIKLDLSSRNCVFDEATLISSSDVQPLKISSLTYLILDGITKDVNDVQSTNEPGSKNLTLSGISILDNEEHPLNAYEKIKVMFECNFISFKLLHP